MAGEPNQRAEADAIAEPGCVPINPFPSLDATRSFVSGDPTSDRLRVTYFRRLDDDALVARVWFGPGSEGPPGHAHGGSVAAVLDEAMGASAWIAGHAVVAARLVVDFLRMVPLGIGGTIEAWVDRIDGRKVTTRARLQDQHSQVLAQAEGLFVMLPPERVEEFRRRMGS